MLWRIALSLVLLATLFVGIRLFVPVNRSPASVVWLTPAEFTAATKPGFLLRFKYRIARVAGPLIRRWRSPRAQIDIKTAICALPPDFEPARLTSPLVAANEPRRSAWILSESEFKILGQKLQTNAKVSLLNSPRITTLDGGQAQIQVSSLIQQRPPVSAGLTIDVLPKINVHAVRLLISASMTQRALDSAPGASLLQTNFTAISKATVPNAGALAILCRDKSNTGATNYFILISPTASDSRGNRLKL